MKTSLPLSLAVLLSATAAPALAGEPTYVYVDLGTLGGPESVAYGLNDARQVVGWSHITGCTVDGVPCRRAYLWENGQMTDLGLLSGDEESFARAINASGVVVGTSELDIVAGSGTFHAFVYENGTMTPLPTLGQDVSFAHDINDAGRIAGHTNDPVTLRDRAVYWENGVITNAGATEGHSWNRAYGVSESGVLTGFAWELFQPNDAIVFDSIWFTVGGTDGPFQNAEAFDANDAGTAVGLQAFPSGDWHAAVWQMGVKGAIDAGTLPGLPLAELYDVNEAGVAVGRSYNTFPVESRAVIWDGTTLTDLNDLLPEGTNALLYEAREINENGDIAGTAVVNGFFRAFLLRADGPPWSRYGLAASPANTVDLDGAGSATLGETFDAVATNLTGVGTVYIATLGPDSYPALGGVGLIDPATIVLVEVRPVVGGQSVLSLPIPDEAYLNGIEVYLQAFGLISTAPDVWELSNGLKLPLCE